MLKIEWLNKIFTVSQVPAEGDKQTWAGEFKTGGEQEQALISYMRRLVFDRDSKLYSERHSLELVLKRHSEDPERADCMEQVESDSEEVIGHYRLLCQKKRPKHKQAGDSQARQASTYDSLSPLGT